MTSVHVFDPAMCCSTGICGPSVDPAVVRFAADLAWLTTQGVSVQRSNLAQQPAAFVEDAAARVVLKEKGEAGLPLIKVDDEVKSSGVFPSRAELAAWTGVHLHHAPSVSSLQELKVVAPAGACCGPASSSTSAAAPSPKNRCC